MVHAAFTVVAIAVGSNIFSAQGGIDTCYKLINLVKPVNVNSRNCQPISTQNLKVLPSGYLGMLVVIRILHMRTVPCS